MTAFDILLWEDIMNRPWDSAPVNPDIQWDIPVKSGNLVGFQGRFDFGEDGA